MPNHFPSPPPLVLAHRRPNQSVASQISTAPHEFTNSRFPRIQELTTPEITNSRSHAHPISRCLPPLSYHLQKSLLIPPHLLLENKSTIPDRKSFTPSPRNPSAHEFAGSDPANDTDARACRSQMPHWCPPWNIPFQHGIGVPALSTHVASASDSLFAKKRST